MYVRRIGGRSGFCGQRDQGYGSERNHAFASEPDLVPELYRKENKAKTLVQVLEAEGTA
jgi:hypothetical protein